MDQAGKRVKLGGTAYRDCECKRPQVRPFFLSFFFLCAFIYLRKREIEHEWEKGRERGGHRIQSRLLALNWKHRAPRGAGTLRS